MRRRERVVDSATRAIALKRLARIDDGIIDLGPVERDHRAHQRRDRIVGVQSLGRLDRLIGLRQVAGFVLLDGKTESRLRHQRVGRDRVQEVLAGCRQVAALDVHPTLGEQRDVERWIERQCLVGDRIRLVELVGVHQHDCVVGARQRVFGVERDRALEGFAAASLVAIVIEHEAKFVVEIGIAGRGRDRALKRALAAGAFQS